MTQIAATDRPDTSDVRSGFLANVEAFVLKFNCEVCCTKQEMLTFRQRPLKIGRCCSLILNKDKSDLCSPNHSRKLNRDYHRKYTNLDQCYEFTSQWELQHLPYLPQWFNSLKINANTTCEYLAKSYEQLQKFKKNVQILNKIKIEYCNVKLEIQNVNDNILQCFMHRIYYYEKIINYYGKYNKYKFYRGFTTADYGICDACGLKIYLKTQYEQAYVRWESIKFMHQMEFITSENETFVCDWCIGSTMQRGYTHYLQLQNKKSLLFVHKWHNMNYLSQLLFILGHVNNTIMKLCFSYYDINSRTFRRGIIKTATSDKITTSDLKIKVTFNGAENIKEKEQWIKLTSLDLFSFFIYQKPSCMTLNGITENYLEESRALVDTTSSFFETAFCKKMAFANTKLSMEWAVPLVYKGKTNLFEFGRMRHMKIIYDALANAKML